MSFDSTDPADLFGGTWERIEGRFLLGASDGYPVDSTGGEPTHTLTIGEMPSHKHNYTVCTQKSSGSAYKVTQAMSSNDFYSYTDVHGTSASGGSQPHNNMPPYLAVYMWKRIS